MTFAATHFLNHAVGLISLEQMHAVQVWRVSITRSWPGTAVLLAAIVAHVALGLYKLALRRTLRLPAWEALQILVALAIPFLLFPHVVNTRVASWAYGVDDIYLYELTRLWPDRAVSQITLLLLVWAHGCIGLHYWLRLWGGYRRISVLLLAAALIVPVLAVTGFIVAGERTAEIMAEPGALEALKARSHWPNARDSAAMADQRDYVRIAFAAALLAICGIYLWRNGGVRAPVLRRAEAEGAPVADASRAVPVTYLDGPTICAPIGMTALEISRANAIPHAALCGGRARCSTCKVRVIVGIRGLPPAAPAEAAMLEAIKASSDVRLACQLRPTHAVTIEVLLQPEHLVRPRLELIDVKEVAAAHASALTSDLAVDVAAECGPAFDAWIRNRFECGVPPPGLPRDGVRLIGARDVCIHEIRAVAFVYSCRGRPLTIVVVPSGGVTSLALSGSRFGYNVRAWSEAGHTYFAVTDAPPDVLEDLADRNPNMNLMPMALGTQTMSTARANPERTDRR